MQYSRRFQSFRMASTASSERPNVATFRVDLCVVLLGPDPPGHFRRLFAFKAGRAQRRQQLPDAVHGLAGERVQVQVPAGNATVAGECVAQDPEEHLPAAPGAQC